ncbi:type II toxin-antitoxin system RelE/ParE family toxin [Muriicola sp. SD30]|uniref:type II toxin-antitoxin system RelE/ParE family toxin n=1 Tax=Muriicola sp. SD30 TaxID=3240936 RepID=UPI00350F0785
MKAKFEVLFLEQAIDFLDGLHEKDRRKVLFNIDKSRFVNDPKLLKKLTEEIWEFRTRFGGNQYRLLAFWDKTKKKETLVVATHGIIKKVDKIPRKEISKANKIRIEYFK